jgi:hypothetical protein
MVQTNGIITGCFLTKIRAISALGNKDFRNLV